MKSVLHPWQLLLLILAGWINHRQQDVIEYFRAENRVLREKLGTKCILLNDEQRRRLAVKGKILGRKILYRNSRYDSALASGIDRGKVGLQRTP